MNEHIKQVDEHSVHSAISQIESILTEAKQIEDISAADIEIVLRIEYIINNFKESIPFSEKQLISITWLDNVYNAINNINSNITTYNSSGSIAYITSRISTYIDTILDVTVKINTVKSKDNLKGIMSSVAKYKNSVGEYLNSIEKRNEQLKKEEESLSSRISTLDGELQIQSEEFKYEINQQKARLDNLITNHQTQIAENKDEFQSQQKEFSDTFTSFQNGNKDEFEKQQGVFENNINEVVGEYKQQISNFEVCVTDIINANTEKLDKHQKDVENIVGIVNTNMFSHKYKEVADTARKSARLWQSLAVGLMVVSAGFAFYSFVIILNQETSWVNLVARIFTVTAFASVAAYSARQASKQEVVERYARKIEMEMVSIDPFLEDLSEEQRQDIKKKIALSLFGKPGSMEISKKDEHSIDLNDSLVENIKKVSTLIDINQ
jgi:FtsZ-binding cell division protein ZapB